MTAPVNGQCPACGSGWIRNRYQTKWECRTCSARFAEPLPVPGLHDVQRALDFHTTDSAYWQTSDGQMVLSFAAQWRLRPSAAGAHWRIRFAPCNQAPGQSTRDFVAVHNSINQGA